MAFWVLAVISVLPALGMILARRAVHCAVLLAVVMLSLAILYAVAGAPFLAFVQIIVYTGAVLMLFLFVLMIVGVSTTDSLRETIPGQRLAAGVAAIALLVLLSLVIGHAAIGPAAPAGPGYGVSNVRGLATLIFTKYVFPFEVTAALLITAALGRHGAGAPGADHAQAHAAGTVPGADRGRPPEPAARPGRLRQAQRGRLPRLAARRQPVRAVGQPDHRPAGPESEGGSRPRRSGQRPVRCPANAAGAARTDAGRRPDGAGDHRVGEGPAGTEPEGARS